MDGTRAARSGRVAVGDESIGAPSDDVRVAGHVYLGLTGVSLLVVAGEPSEPVDGDGLADSPLDLRRERRNRLVRC